MGIILADSVQRLAYTKETIRYPLYAIRFIRKLKRAIFNHDPSFCDMRDDLPSREVAEEYLGHIRAALRQQCGPGPLTILDAGCQAGRLLIPLAQDGHRLIGIDTSAFALRRARQHAQKEALAVQWHRGNLSSLRKWIAPASLDAVICTEVLYLCKDYRQLLRLLIDSVKPGGLICVSHRAALYYVALTFQHGRPEQAGEFLRRSEGPSTDGDYHNWHTPDQLRQLYHDYGLQMLSVHPICSRPTHLSLMNDIEDAIRQTLAAAHMQNSTFSVPTYYLALATTSPT
jgi:2-polyprenyl-3-methyl-5-hydroxy-6-metoxy-1,4-benzoquinol methylase